MTGHRSVAVRIGRAGEVAAAATGEEDRMGPAGGADVAG
jgi:hypothetical protein